MVETWNLFFTLRKYKEFKTQITKIKIKNHTPTTKLLVKKNTQATNNTKNRVDRALNHLMHLPINI
jgi:alpha-acetolactate decarboxylase